MIRFTKRGPSYCVDPTAVSLRTTLTQTAPLARDTAALATDAKPVVVVTTAHDVLRALARVGVLAVAVLLARPAVLQAAVPAAAGGITILASTMDRGFPEIAGWLPSGSITVDFTNERPSPAKAVRFAFVGDDEKTYTFDDVGTFSQNVPIRHFFRHKHARDDGPLEVIAVRWADGSVWTNEDGPATPRRQEAGE